MKILESILIFAQNYSDLNKFAAGKYDHIDFKPPESVAKAAKTGLELRKKNKGKGGLSTQEAGKQGIGSGVARAVSLANRKNISPATARRMKAFFDRHEKSKKIDPGKTHATDKGWIAWQLWGGNAGRSWANKLCKQMDAADSSKADDVSYSDDVNYNKDSCPECKDPHCCMNFASTHDLSDGDTNEAKCTGYKSSPVGSPRQRAFCKRHCGMKKKLTSKKVADDPESCINKGLRRWKCRCS